jgi:GMP synthase PP-ATPase subunit
MVNESASQTNFQLSEDDVINIVFGGVASLCIAVFICVCICKRPRRDIPVSELLKHYEWNQNDKDLEAALKVSLDVITNDDRNKFVSSPQNVKKAAADQNLLRRL